MTKAELDALRQDVTVKGAATVSAFNTYANAMEAEIARLEGIIATPPPPVVVVPPSTGTAPDPVGGKVLTHTRFTGPINPPTGTYSNQRGTVNGWAFEYWKPNTPCPGRLSTDPAKPGLIVPYPAGFVGGAGPIYLEQNSEDFRILRTRLWFELSPNWIGHLTGGNFIWIEVGSAAQKPIALFNVVGHGTGPLRPGLQLQDLYAPFGVPNDCLTGPGPEVKRGQRHCYEAELCMNIPGKSDGYVKLWLDGTFIAEKMGLAIVGPNETNPRWTMGRGNPKWGGLGDKLATQQELRWEEVWRNGRTAA